MSSYEEDVQQWVEQLPLGVIEDLKASMRDIAPCRVTLVTYGTSWNHDTDGMELLMRLFDQVDVFNDSEDLNARIRNYTHRVDEIFDNWDRLSSRGKYLSAQAEFIDIYSRHFGDETFNQFFRAMMMKIYDSIEDTFFQASVIHFISCRHGHHRSQAFAELLAKLLRHHCQPLRVDVWHLDDRKCCYDRRYGLISHMRNNSNDFETHFLMPLKQALQPACYFTPLHSTRCDPRAFSTDNIGSGESVPVTFEARSEGMS